MRSVHIRGCSIVLHQPTGATHWLTRSALPKSHHFRPNCDPSVCPSPGYLSGLAITVCELQSTAFHSTVSSTAMSTEHPTGSDPIPSTSSSSNSSFEERRQLFLTGANSDVTIVVKRTTTFKAHKAILASRSPVFAAIFADGEYSINQENCVNIGDVDPVIFKELLRYIYTDRVRQWATIAKELYIAADKYHVKCLKELLIEGLSKTLTPKNFAEVFLFADSNGIFDLKKYCLMFFIRDHQVILETEDWDAPLFDENLALLDKIMEVLSEMVLRRGKCCEKQCLEFALHVCGFLGEQKVRRRHYLSAIVPEASRRRGDEPEDEDEDDPLQQLQRSKRLCSTERVIAWLNRS